MTNLRYSVRRSVVPSIYREEALKRPSRDPKETLIPSSAHVFPITGHSREGTWIHRPFCLECFSLLNVVEQRLQLVGLVSIGLLDSMTWLIRKKFHLDSFISFFRRLQSVLWNAVGWIESSSRLEYYACMTLYTRKYIMHLYMRVRLCVCVYVCMPVCTVVSMYASM